MAKKSSGKKTFFGKEAAIALSVIVLILMPAFVLVFRTENFNSKAANITPSGEAMPVGDLANWKQVFTEDFPTDVPIGQFPGTVYQSKWGVYLDGWKDTSKNGTYMPSKVLSVSGGVLDYYIHTENNVRMVSAPLPKLPAPQTYGRYSVRFKSDPIAGYKNAWLLWPDSEVWSDGEIDFPEGNLDGTIEGFSHCVGNPEQNCLAINTGKPFTSWHTATTEWIPGRVTFYLDGIQVGTTTSGVPNKPMHWVLQTETNLEGIIPDASAAGHVQIDWVAAYSYCPTCTPTTPSTMPTVDPSAPTSTPVPADTTPPSVTLTSPREGSSVFRNANLTLTANANDASGISKVEFYVNGTIICTDTAVPYSCSWGVPNAKKQSYTLTAKAFDTKNNSATSAPVRITTKN